MEQTSQVPPTAEQASQASQTPQAPPSTQTGQRHYWAKRPDVQPFRPRNQNYQSPQPTSQSYPPIANGSSHTPQPIHSCYQPSQYTAQYHSPQPTDQYYQAPQSMTTYCQPSESTNGYYQHPQPVDQNYQYPQPNGAYYPPHQSIDQYYQPPQDAGQYNPPPQSTVPYYPPHQPINQYYQPPQGAGQYYPSPQTTGQYNPPPAATGQGFQPPQTTGQYNLPPQAAGQYIRPPQAAEQYNPPPQTAEQYIPPRPVMDQGFQPPQAAEQYNPPSQTPDQYCAPSQAPEQYDPPPQTTGRQSAPLQAIDQGFQPPQAAEQDNPPSQAAEQNNTPSQAAEQDNPPLQPAEQDNQPSQATKQYSPPSQTPNQYCPSPQTTRPHSAPPQTTGYNPPPRSIEEAFQPPQITREDCQGTTHDSQASQNADQNGQEIEKSDQNRRQDDQAPRTTDEDHRTIKRNDQNIRQDDQSPQTASQSYHGAKQDHLPPQTADQDNQDMKQDCQASHSINQDHQASHVTNQNGQDTKQDDQDNQEINQDDRDTKQDNQDNQEINQDDRNTKQHQASKTKNQARPIIDQLFWPQPPPNFEEIYPSIDSLFSGQNSYLVYQSYQKRFVTWLVKAAAKWGQAFKPLSQHGTSVPFAELPRLAKAVARGGKIPQLALDYLKYMIKLRGDWDTRTEIIPKPTTEDSEKNERVHSGAMAVLRKVRDHLTPRRIRSDHAEPAGGQAEPAGSEGELTEDYYSLAQLPGEAFFAWVCFFNDLFTIRSYLRWHWESYQQSSESLINLALVTNTAIRLIRANCEAHINATARLSGMPREFDIAEWIFRGITGAHWPGHLLDTDHEDYYASWCCYEVHCLKGVLKYLHQTGRNTILVAHPDHLTDVTRLVGSKPSYGEDRIVSTKLFAVYLSSFMHNLYVLGRDNNEAVLLPCYDELTSGWFQLEREDENAFINGRVPLWLTVSFQICAEMRWVLGDYSPTAVNDLHEHGQTLMGLTQSYLPRRHKRVTKGKLWKLPDGDKDPILDGMKHHEKRMMGDNYTTLLTRKLENTEFMNMQLWGLEQRYRNLQYCVVELHRSIIPAALLYVSMRGRGLDCRWEDMDFVLITRGQDILQMSDHRWEDYHRCPGKTRVKASFKSHFDYLCGRVAPLSLNLSSRFFYDLLLPYITSASHDVKPSGRPSNKTLDNITDRVYPYPYLYLREQVKRRLNLGKNEIINVLEVLNLVSAARYHDEMLASFDWFRMHDSCEEFFRRLRQKYMESFFSPPSENDGSTRSYLDALYQLLFPNTSNRGAENMILAALCVDPHAARGYDIPDSKTSLDKWDEDIIKPMKNLDISLESAAAVLQPSLLEAGEFSLLEEAREMNERHLALRSDVPKHFSNPVTLSLFYRSLMTHDVESSGMSDEPPGTAIPKDVSVWSFSSEVSD
ncbi:hypothetical protein GGR55DRAFT_702346 [Xylaria sp. FL0064]|nr:hypothetical protein GGR55DRAFT_702346 [Xylaria sp. FL0064]